MTRRFTFLLISSVLALGCAAASAQAQRHRAESWSAFMQRYIDQDFRANPAFAVVQGKHEYDGRLPDWSETGIRNEIARLHSAVAAAQALVEGGHHRLVGRYPHRSAVPPGRHRTHISHRSSLPDDGPRLAAWVPRAAMRRSPSACGRAGCG